MIAARRPLVVALVAVLLAAAGFWLAHSASGALRREHVVVAGVPLDIVHPAGANVRRPGVVVAHGYGGSARLMAPFGDTLATRGYVVVLLDFSGHGANTARLPTDSLAPLQHDLDVALEHLRSLPDVDPAKVALVGHSMGATAVTDYGATHPDVTAIVAISLPESAGLPADRPDRLLLLVGALEFPAFHEAASHAARTDPRRSLRVVPGVEHISILYSPRTHREVVSWLDASFGGPPADAALPAPLRRPGGAFLLLVALLIGLYPVARLLLGRPPIGSEPKPRVRGRWRVEWPALEWPSLVRPAAVTAGAALLGAPVAALAPTDRLPLAIGGYIAGLTAVTGALMLLYQLRRGRGFAAVGVRTVLAAPILLVYAALAIAAPLQLGVTHAIPVGPRWWLLALVWAALALFACAADLLADRNALGSLAASAVITVALAAAAVLGLTSTFVLLVVPLLAALQLWQASWSAVLHRFAAPSWLVAAVGALVVAWPLSIALPLIP